MAHFGRTRIEAVQGMHMVTASPIFQFALYSEKAPNRAEASGLY